MLVGKDQYYIKNEKNGEIEMLSSENLVQFCSKCSVNVPVENVTWLTCLPRGKNECTCFMNVLDRYNDFIRSNLMCVDSWEDGCYGFYNNCPKDVIKVIANEAQAVGINLNVFTRIAKNYANYYYNNLYGFEKNLQYQIKSPDVLSLIKDKFGIVNLRSFIKNHYQVPYPVRLPKDTVIKQLLNTVEFKYKSFEEYVLYEACRQGYDDVNEGIISDWLDTLCMEKRIYGKIEDKYPENLSSFHNILSAKCKKMQEKIDEKNWRIQIDNAKNYEYKGTVYSIIVPENVSDLYDEAQQQSNCVASYTNKITNGTSWVFFLRATKNIEKSVVTIEVNIKDKKVIQVKGKNNREPSREQWNFVNKWAEKVGLVSAYYAA